MDWAFAGRHNKALPQMERVVALYEKGLAWAVFRPERKIWRNQ